MNIDEIMEKLQKDHIWESGEQDTPELAPCPFCGVTGNAQILVRHPMYGKPGAWVRCRNCGACGPAASTYATISNGGRFRTNPLPVSLERGIFAAADAWNTKAVDRARMGNMNIKEAQVRPTVKNSTSC